MSHTDYSTSLLPEHRELLTASGISPVVAAERGYRSVTTKAELRGLGFSDPQCRVPSLLIPISNTAGEIATYHNRPDEPRLKDGKRIKYEMPGKTRMVLDVPKRARQHLGDPAQPLFITEGSRKADAAVTLGLCCVALLGVWSWRGTNENGGRTALADWEAIALNGRKVYLVFDSDVMTKTEVYAALARLKSFLESRGAQVSVIYLPPGEGGQKVGLDDFKASGHSVADLMALARAELLPPPGSTENAESAPYESTAAGIVWLRPTADGSVRVRLSNFQARIIAETVEDDGAETRRLFEVEARRADRVSRCSVPAASFDGLGWVNEALGASAIVLPGQALRDHARAAIRLLSGEVPEQRIYTSVGWREIRPDCWAYLHGGGAIGDTGSESILTRLSGALKGYELPPPPVGEQRRAALGASLGLLDLVEDAVSVPAFAAIWRAALGPADFSVHFSGQSGEFKTELASLLQQHFGATMDSRNLPACWSSTDNSLEAGAFGAACALYCIDDFTPVGSPTDVQRLHARADRVLRAQGNNSARQRLRPDGSPRPARPPRGLILSTGEDVPHGQSLKSRMLILEIGPGDIEASKLTLCQKQAGEGRYAESMAAFLSWLAPQYGAVRAGMRPRLEALRQQAATAEGHRRTPAIVANLAFGFALFLEFARFADALTEREAAELGQRAWKALGVAAARQDRHQQTSEPTQRFRELLAAALAAGRCHLAALSGEAPPHSGVWGWRDAGQTYGLGRDWRPQGARVGWIEGIDVYLIPDEALNCARRVGAEGGDGLVITGRTLHKRLKERGLLASTDLKRGTLTIRKQVEDRRVEVLHLLSASLMSAEPDQTDQTDHSAPQGASVGTPFGSNGQFLWSVNGGAGQEPDHDQGQKLTTALPGEALGGQNGQFGQVLRTYNAGSPREDMDETAPLASSQTERETWEEGEV